MNDHGGGSEVEWNNKDEREEKVNEDILFSKKILKKLRSVEFCVYVLHASNFKVRAEIREMNVDSRIGWELMMMIEISIGISEGN